MEKIKEFVEGTRFLAPGIVVGLIFYMYADVKFDQFGFLLFCAIAIILVSTLTDALLELAALLYSLGFWAGVKAQARVKPDKTPQLPSTNLDQIRSSARNALETARLP